RTGPAIVSVNTHTTAARIAARLAAEPKRCSDCCSAASAMAFLIGSMTPVGASPSSTSGAGSGAGRASMARGSRRIGVAPRGRPPPFPGRDAGARRLGSGRFGSGMNDELRPLLLGLDGETRERKVACVAGGVAELLLDAQQLVVLRDALAASGRTGLDLPAAHCHGQVGDRGVLGLAGAVAHHGAVAAAVRQVYRVQRLG